MNEPKTPNLGLNKIDRSSPSTTYFDLDKYLDQNWEKVEDFAEQVEEKVEETAAQVSNIQERLDTEKRRSVTLEPGLQIINAERASPFKLEGLKGRTLVNLLGRAGGCEDLSKIGVYQSILSLDSTNKVQGSNGLKMTIDSGTSGIGYFNVALKGGRFYVAIAEVKNGNGTSVYINLAGVGAKGNPVTDTAKFNVTWTRYSPPSDMTLNVDVGVVGTAVGQFGYADAVRLYEVSAVEYAALANMTPEQIAAKYPYVDSVQPVRNPYAIRYGENLLPPFYEWNDGGIPYKISSSYEVVRNASDALFIGASLYVKVPVVPGMAYTLNFELFGDVSKAYINWSWNDKDGNRISWTDGNKTEITAIAPNNAVIADVRVTGTAPGTFTFKNPMLTIGTTAKTFKPREDAILALQTDLYADPLTLANADEVFEKDSRYFKLTKWKKIVMNSAYSYAFFNSYTGGKCVRLMYDIADRNKGYLPIAIKYDGTYLKDGSPSLYVDQYSRGDWDTGANGAFLGIGVSSADSGWGDAYTPTADEIKAYFMGWIMYLSGTGGSGKSGITPYNGTGTKYWARVASDGNTLADGTSVLPTTQAPNFTPYQLVYQLATPIVELITSEGQLTLIEGNNQVEVGTGIVLRESNKPGYTSNTYYFNDTYYGSSLKYKVGRLFVVYKNGVRDYKAIIYSGNNQNGNQKARLDEKDYNSSATYTITYFMLDTTPAAPFVGSVAETEKALLMDLVNSTETKVTMADVGQAEANAKNASLPIAGGTTKGYFGVGAGYFEIHSYGSTYGAGKLQTYYDANNKRFIVQGRDADYTVTGVEISAKDFVDSTGTRFSDLKQSGVDAKNRIVGAINAKGGSASANDTWPTLETKVRGIETGPKYATGLVTTGAGVFTINAYDGQTYSTAIVIVTGLGFKPNRIVIESVANQSYGFVTTFPSSSGLSPDGKQTYFIGGLNYANSKVDGVNSYVIDGGFRLGVYGTNREFRWHAYG
ncbi:hypothetical protein [Paenibacillus illinoisensis]|uniref:hypothetical protein n=1 Tax=Paenibacillus illinoisensis TaxID=59845 RepID=UPI001C8D9D34|nr:hypothetical protein [Paenibacillus illinoisensis]MBY0219452.1 hypothetical protein [Paenibacillus illinoisensis]